MHNKRIGRDDILKIEVCLIHSLNKQASSITNPFRSGLVLLPVRHGDLSLAVTETVVDLVLLVVVVLPLLAAAPARVARVVVRAVNLANYLLVRMSDVTATVIMIAMAVVIVTATALAAPILGKATWRLDDVDQC